MGTPRIPGLKVACAGLAGILIAGSAVSQTADDPGYGADAEFHLARLAYPTRSYANSRGLSGNPMWRVDWPDAELNFLPALARLTNMSVDLSAGTDPSRLDARSLAATIERLHIEATDDRIFDYPLIFMQQPAQAGWWPTEREAERLREYLMRGGFLLIDDFHGQQEYFAFQDAIRRVLPDREIIEIPADDPLMTVFYDLGDRVQIPGLRHLQGRGFGARMQGPPYWLAIYDDDGRIMVGINFNIDMGDAWEHADDPYYPAPMTGQAYRLGVNYIIYAMTH